MYNIYYINIIIFLVIINIMYFFETHNDMYECNNREVSK